MTDDCHLAQDPDRLPRPEREVMEAILRASGGCYNIQRIDQGSIRMIRHRLTLARDGGNRQPCDGIG
jgi:hypothetical protein